jgi:hypothetical protein
LSEEKFLLSKSQVLRGLKCPAGLWNEIYNFEEWDKSEDKSYRYYNSLQKLSIQRLARQCFPEGEVFSEKTDLKSLKEKRIPIFHYKTEFQMFQVQIDVLKPINSGWEIFQIKPVSKIKKEYSLELGVSVYLLQALGWEILGAKILAIDSSYNYVDKIEVSSFFKIIDLSQRVFSQLDEVKNKLVSLSGYLAPEKKKPENVLRCASPKDCRNIPICWKDKENLSIFQLRESNHLSSEFLAKGIQSWGEIPPETELNFAQRVQIQCSIHNKPHLDKEKISSFLESFHYPLHFLDFETINPAIPIYPNSKPFQHVPFLYVLFRQLTPESPLEEFFFIDLENDPRKGILENLEKQILPGGSLVCYNDYIEKKCIFESVQLHSQYDEWFQSIKDSFLDISKPFRDFYYYHPLQKGSASLKAVFPALTGLGYGDLDIQEGGLANHEFLKLKLQKEQNTEETSKILEQLVAYCRMDSWAMIKILEKLKDLDSSAVFLLVEKA